MKIKLLTILFLLLSLSSTKSFGQDLMDELGGDEPTTDYAYATFKTSRVILNHSIQNIAPNEMLLIISHHFGALNMGAYNMFGLDQATIRIGLEYGVNRWLTVGAGRSSYKKMVDGFAKIQLLRQSSGKINMPISLTYFTSMGINTLKWENPDRKNYFSSRLSYVHQLLIARKFSSAFSLQLMPTVVHRNLVSKVADQNDVFAMGAGGRLKLTQRLSVNAEYFYLLPGETADNFENTLSLGLDIETGGHVFQLFFTNATPINENAFITETTGDWFKGDIFFGFNITRTFSFKGR